MKRNLVIVATALIGWAPPAASQTPPSTPAPAAGAAGSADPLPPGPGHDTTVKVCSGCHQLDVVAQQKLNHDGWTEMVNMMVSNGATATEAEVTQIVDYLSKAFPAPTK